MLATAILLPFNKYLEKLACLTIRDKEEDSDVPFLDERFLNTPSVATERAKSLAEKWLVFLRVRFSAHLNLLTIMMKRLRKQFMKRRYD